MDSPTETIQTEKSSAGRALLISIAGCFALVLLTTLAEATLLSTVAAGCTVPPRIHLAIYARTYLLQALPLLPVAIVAVLLLHALAAKRMPKQIHAWQAGAATFLIVLFIGVANIEQSDFIRVYIIAIKDWQFAVILLVCCLVLALVLKWLTSKGLPRWYVGTILTLAFISLAFFVAAVPIVNGTPLAGPSAYKLAKVTEAQKEQHDVSAFDRPNVLFIVLDTTRWDRLTPYGYDQDTTPFLNALVKKGVTFDRAVAAGVPTRPSHSCMFTGLSVTEHGVGAGADVLDEDFKTLAENAREQGYRTVALSCNSNVDKAFQMTQGFQQEYGVWQMYTLQRSYLSQWMYDLGLYGRFDILESDEGAGLTNYLAVNWLDHEYEGKQPFFMFVNFLEPHTPHDPPREYREMFIHDPDRLKRSYKLTEIYDKLVYQDRSLRYMIDPSQLPDKDLKLFNRLYDASLRYGDDRLRELVTHMEDRGLLNNTVVLVLADHGEAMGDDGVFNHILSLRDTLMHVPMTIFTPSVPTTPKRVPDVVSTKNVYDVLTEVMRKQTPPAAEPMAQRFVALTEGQPVISEYYPDLSPAHEKLVLDAGLKPNTRFLRFYRAASTADWKYMYFSDDSTALYEIQKDPLELKNVQQRFPEQAAEYADFMNDWFDHVKKYDLSRSKKPTVSRMQNELLKSLGYAGADEEEDK